MSARRSRRRTALGASPGRIAVRLLTESLLLATAGGALGLAFGRWVTTVIEPLYIVMPVGLANLFEGNVWVRLMRSLHGLEQREIGFETEHQVQRQLYELARQRLAALPGVVAATLARDVPGTGFVHQTRLVLPQQPDDSFQVDRITIGRDYFSTFEIGEVRGRRFDDGDRAGGMGAVIVNGAFARRFFPGVEPLGQEIRLPDLEIDSNGDRLMVLGVAPDIHHGSRRDELAPLVYLPLSQHLGSMWLVAVARTAGPPQAAMRQVRETLATVHPDLALTDIGTYDRQVAIDLHQQRLQGTLAGWLSLFGLGAGLPRDLQCGGPALATWCDWC